MHYVNINAGCTDIYVSLIELTVGTVILAVCENNGVIISPGFNFKTVFQDPCSSAQM